MFAGAIILSSVAVAANGMLSPAVAPLPHHPRPLVAAAVYPPFKPYAYEYGVSDSYSGAVFSAKEASTDGNVVSGSYQVHLPDGRVQRVTYTADPVNGYVADVTYEGEAQYPEYVPKDKTAASVTGHLHPDQHYVPAKAFKPHPHYNPHL